MQLSSSILLLLSSITIVFAGGIGCTEDDQSSQCGESTCSQPAHIWTVNMVCGVNCTTSELDPIVGSCSNSGNDGVTLDCGPGKLTLGGNDDTDQASYSLNDGSCTEGCGLSGDPLACDNL